MILKSKSGFILPYVVFISILILNMFIFVTLTSLNTDKYYRDKTNYYHVMILEERAKRLAVAKVDSGSAKAALKETVYDGDEYLFFTYLYNYTSKEWEVSVRIHTKEADEYATIYYDPIMHVLDYAQR